MPVDPASMLGVTEWQIPGVEGLDGATPGVAQDERAGGFGKLLGELEGLQTDAADAARGLADGTATDVSAAVMAVERARLSMQLASQIRTKATEAYQDIFHTQV